jgi:CHD5-like protein
MELELFLPIIVVLTGCLAKLANEISSSRTSPVTSSIENEIRQLKIEISKLHPVSDFVQVSKKQREVGKLEKKLQQEQQTQTVTNQSTSRLALFVSSYVVPISYVLLLFSYWSTPIFIIPSHWLFPFSYFIRASKHSSGTVGIHAYLALLHVVLSEFISFLGKASGLVKPKQPKSIVQQFMSMTGLQS